MMDGESYARVARPIKSEFLIYGAGMTVESAGVLGGQIQNFLQPFEVKRPVSDGVQTHGVIRPFDLNEVTHSLSGAVASQRRRDGVADIYSLSGRHWILDDRWGA